MFNIYFGRGYENDAWWNKKLILKAIYIFWLFITVCLVLNISNILFNFSLFVLFRHYFINGRWRSLLRGAGAPGYISHYCLLFVNLIDISIYFDSTLILAEKILMVLRYDFATIMLCSGTYKALVGYFNRNGMEFGAVNPLWGYHYKFFKKISPDNWYLHFQNITASAGELLIGAFLIFPSLQLYGALICMLSFLYLIPLIRLGRLSSLMIIIPILFLPDLGIYFNNYQASFISNTYHDINEFHETYFYYFTSAVCYLYCIMLPFTKLTQYFNLFLNYDFPIFYKFIINKFSSMTPIIIWRVFTADVTDFFIRITLLDKENKSETILLDEDQIYNYKKWNNFIVKHRFLQVTESIAIVSIFNTLKYFPSKNSLFKEKLIKYSNTLPGIKNKLIKYEYVRIVKEQSNFTYIPSAYYVVDVKKNTIEETIIEEEHQPKNIASYSPIRESLNFGSYEKKSSNSDG